MEPRILGDELLAEGRRVRLYRRLVEAGGVTFEKDVVEFGEAVVIVPILEDKRIVMLRQWRAPVKGWVLEVPAGRVERGESLEEAARRELEEETGYSAGELVKLASVYATPGYSDEVMHVFAARELVKRAPHPERGEVIEILEVDPNEYLSRVGKEVCDLKTVASILLCKLHGLI